MHFCVLVDRINQFKLSSLVKIYSFFIYNFCALHIQFIKKKVKLSLLQAVEARRVVGSPGSHIF
jgi:hypothetical protein